jgi:hypothetical protein
LVIAALAACAPSWAASECAGHVSRIYTGDGGNVWVFTDSTVAWYVTASDPNTKNILATATTAMVTGLQVTVRFQADGVVCNAGSPRTDAIGMWLIAY